MKRTNVETPEQDVYRFTFTADAQELEAAVQAAYERTRSQIQIEGYAKGEADRAAIEAAQGESVFWYEAINDCMAAQAPALLEAAIAELHLYPVTQATYELAYASKEQGFGVTAMLVNRPALTVAQYTGFQAHCAPTPVREGDVEHFVQRRRMAMTRKLPQTGPAALGMCAVVDYEGFLDGVPFEGGKAQRQLLELGAGRMIPGFEEGILGHNPGESFTLPVTFPEKYPAAELAGKAVEFRMQLHELYKREVPALDDAFAQANGAENLAAYRVQVREKLEQMHLDNAMNRARTEIVRQLGAHSTGVLPDALTADAFTGVLEQFKQQLATVRKPLEQYLAETRQTREQLETQLRLAAEEQMRVHLSLLEIARLEGLEPTEAEVDAEIRAEAEKEGCAPEEFLVQVDRHTVRRGICAQRAADFVVNHSQIMVDR